LTDGQRTGRKTNRRIDDWSEKRIPQIDHVPEEPEIIAVKVPAGRYDLVVTFDGFETTTLHVNVGTRPISGVRVTMPLARIKKEVTVGAGTDGVRADSGSNVDASTLDEQAHTGVARGHVTGAPATASCRSCTNIAASTSGGRRRRALVAPSSRSRQYSTARRNRRGAGRRSTRAEWTHGARLIAPSALPANAQTAAAARSALPSAGVGRHLSGIVLTNEGRLVQLRQYDEALKCYDNVVALPSKGRPSDGGRSECRDLKRP
jgi:hypothetical protein